MGSEGFSPFFSHSVHSFTMKMHNAVQQDRRTLRKARGKNLNHEDAEPEEDKGEMDNFQDLQLGSITPVVRFRTCSHWLPSDHFFDRTWTEFSCFDLRPHYPYACALAQ
jgi:hypothetical protein